MKFAIKFSASVTDVAFLLVEPLKSLPNSCPLYNFNAVNPAIGDFFITCPNSFLMVPSLILLSHYCSGLVAI
jgi:hypothetical protein